MSPVLTLMLVLAACGTDEPEVAEPAVEPDPDVEEAEEPANDERLPDMDPVELDAVSFLAVDDPLNVALFEWIEAVEEATGGLVTINWDRGPESIGTFDQIDAVQAGVVDINFNVTSFYEDQAPELRAFSLSEHMPWEEREVGFYDLMVERHEELGLRYLGRYIGQMSYYIWSQDPVESPEDLSGRRMRTAALYDRFMSSYGIVPVTVPVPEVYSSLEAGLVEGTGYPLIGPRDLGWTDHLDYVIDHPFFVANGVIVMNLDTWNDLPSEVQDIIEQVTAEFEHEMWAYFGEAVAQERDAIREEGLEFIQFSEEEGEAFEQQALEIEWDWLESEVPELIDELRDVTTSP